MHFSRGCVNARQGPVQFTRMYACRGGGGLWPRGCSPRSASFAEIVCYSSSTGKVFLFNKANAVQHAKLRTSLGWTPRQMPHNTQDNLPPGTNFPRWFFSDQEERTARNEWLIRKCRAQPCVAEPSRRFRSPHRQENQLETYSKGREYI